MREINVPAKRTTVTNIDTRLKTVYMLVDLVQGMPVGGPYFDLEHSRDVWHWFAAPGVNLSHLRLIVRDRQDLVDQVRQWRDDLRERQAARLGRGCCG